MVPLAHISLINALIEGQFWYSELSTLFFHLLGDDILNLWAKFSQRVSGSRGQTVYCGVRSSVWTLLSIRWSWPCGLQAAT